MIYMFLSLKPFYTRNKAFKNLQFFSVTQIFYPLQLMAYSEKLGLRHYVGFSQIRSHTHRHTHKYISSEPLNSVHSIVVATRHVHCRSTDKTNVGTFRYLAFQLLQIGDVEGKT